jgi:hypothetical protein
MVVVEWIVTTAPCVFGVDTFPHFSRQQRALNRPMRNGNPSKKRLGWDSRVAAEFTPDELVTVARIRTVDVGFPGDPGKIVVAALF